MKRNAAISRRQFLTGAFRGRDVTSSESDAGSSLPRDLVQGVPGERYCFTWSEELRVPDWEDGIDRVLEELEDLKGIEDF